MSNRNRYTRRHEQRIELENQLKDKRCDKGPPSRDDLSRLADSIRKNKVADFALGKIYQFDLNVDVSAVVDPQVPSCTLYDMAVELQRDKIAFALLRAGATPVLSSSSSVRANFDTCAFDLQWMAYCVWISRLWFKRATGAHAKCSLCSGGDKNVIAFAACQHTTCASCFWNKADSVDPVNWWVGDGRTGESYICSLLSSDTCCLVCGNVDNAAGYSSASLPAELPSALCRATSLERYEALPCSFADGPQATKQAVDRAMHPYELARMNLGATQTQRCDELRKACAADDCRRIAALVEAGVDLEHRDEYGMTPLLLAAWLGHSRATWLLAKIGADVTARVPQGHTAIDIAAAQGHENVLRALGAVASVVVPSVARTESTCPHIDGKLLMRSGHMNIDYACTGVRSSFQEHYSVSGGCNISDEAPVVTVLVPAKAAVDSVTWALHGVKGAEMGAFCVDHCFTEEFVTSLHEVFAVLPVSLEEKERCAARSYFCDVLDKFTATIEHVVAAAANALQPRSFETDGQQLCASAVVFPEMRFLHYQRDGSDLTAHVDLSHPDIRTVRTVGDRSKQLVKSTHTLILYLTDCPEGGETVLLRSLPGSGAPNLGGEAVASVAPRTGRLLLFPHKCPHEGRAINGEYPKLLLRGEVCLGL
jgi:hypothetical protein